MKWWVCLHRKLQNNSIYSNLELIWLWSHFLLSANHQDNTFYFWLEKITVKKWEFVTSMKKLWDLFWISKPKIYRMVKVFEEEWFVKRVWNTKYTVISILNWHLYQDGETQKKRRKNASVTTSETQPYTNNNVNNEEQWKQKEFAGDLELLISKWNWVKRIWQTAGLMQCKWTTTSLEQVYKKIRKKNTAKDIWIAINNYMTDIKNRDKKDSYSTHRFSLYKFLKQDNGFNNFYNI
jgi:hypothetical protein